MAYEKQTWATGDTVTASKLNHMEDGIAGARAGIILELVGTSTPLTMTFEEIADALASGTNVYIKHDDHNNWAADYNSEIILGRVLKAYKYDNAFRIVAEWGGNIANVGSANLVASPAVLVFSADDYDAYPAFYKRICASLNTTTLTIDTAI